MHMQVIVNGLATSFERTGSGPQVLVLHGWADRGASWYAYAEALAANYEVIVPDLPGFGGTEAPKTVWGLDDYSQFVAAFIAKLKLNPRAVVGHSNGGAIAIHGLAQGIFRADKLVLLASAGIRGENKGRRAVWRAVAKTGKLATAPLPAAARQKLRRKLYKAAGSDMLIAEHLQETFKRVVAADVRDDARRVGVPALLVYGTADTDAPLHYGELLAEAMPHAKLVSLPGVGHFLQQDAPSEVTRLTKEFV